MAEKKASLILTLKDEASSALGKLGNSFSSLKAKVLGVAAVFATLTAAGISAVRAYMGQENATNKLNIALKNQGIYSAKTSQDIHDYAAALQRTTAFGDEAILETQALLTTFGLAGDKLKDTTKAAIDLSVGLGIDLKAATMLLGKAFVGETASLSRYGIKIDESIPKAQKFEAVMGQLNQRFGGAAEAQLQTTAGQIANLSNRLGDLKERIGGELIPVVRFWTDALDKAVGFVERLSGATKNDLQGRELTIDALNREKKALIEKSTMEGTYLDEITQKRIVSINSAIAKEKEKLAVETAAAASRQELSLAEKAFLDQLDAEKAAKEEEKRAAELEKLDQQTATILAKHQTRNDLRGSLSQFFHAREIAMLTKSLTDSEQMELAAHLRKLTEHKKYADIKTIQEQVLADAQAKANEELNQKIIKWQEDRAQKSKALDDKIIQWQNEHREKEKRIQEQRAQDFNKFLNFISSAASSNNKSMAALGKAASITQATIDTYAAANSAFKAMAGIPLVGPALGAAAAAAAVAVGLSNVARIRSMAEGGMVLPTAGGTIARVAEAGRAEAVIPLDDPRTQEKLSGLGGGVTINVGTMIADDRGIKELAVRIDDALFSLQRNRQSVSF
jgi:hypothetical protein